MQQGVAWIVGAAVVVIGCSPQESQLEPPRAARIEHVHDLHGHQRQDPYYWLNDRENPEVISYLEAENEYLEATMAHTEALQETLFEEIVGRIQEVDESVPFRLDDYYYYYRYEEDGEYRIHARRKGSMEAAEEIVLDLNELAEGHEFFSLRGPSVSFEHDIIAYGVDTVGRRFYDLRFRDLKTGEDLPDLIPGVTGNVAWANDNRTIFYGRQHPETLRWYQIWRHELGTDPSDDVLVYQEDDDTYSAYVFKTKSKEYLVIHASQTLASEVRVLEANDPTGEFRVVEPRRRDHEYALDHFGDSFYIRTNDQAKNFRLMKTPVGETGRTHWVEVIAHREDVYLSGFEIFDRFLVLAEREGGLVQLRVRPWNGDQEHYVDFGEPAYDAWVGVNPQFDTDVLRYNYTSMTTPLSVFDYDMTSREKTLLKQDPVLGDFDPANYVTERLHAPARDGVEVPVSIVYRKGFERDGSGPLLLYGYGSYGASMDASFSSPRLSLLDRGFAFAIAHIRGGQELGRDWYENGKLFHKKNTFTDFIDVGQYLVDEGYTSPDRLYAMGGSAGGLLMGAVTNMAPDLFHGVISHVPFVDVVTTMLDDSIPLTSGEWDEWGDPRQKDYYDYILSYSPYDNIEAKDYPHLLVTTGLHDSQVQYWEPAKYVARMRELKTDDNLLLLRTNMEAGHGGATGRFKRHRETALDYAFLLDLAGITE
jgi:oligopeptidase B